MVQGLAQCYQGLTVVAYKQKDFQKGINYTLKEIEYDLQAGDDYSLTYAYYNLAVGYKELRQYEKTGYYLALSKQKMLKTFDVVDKVNLYVSLSELQIDMLEYTRAQELLTEALALAKKHQLKKDEQRLYLVLANIRERQKEYPQAYESLKQYMTLKDSLQNIEKEKISQNLIKKYELLEKQKEINQQKLQLVQQQNKNQKLVLLFLSILLVCVLLLGLTWYNRVRYKQKLQEAFDTIGQEITLMKQHFDQKTSPLAQNKPVAIKQSSPMVMQVIESLGDFEQQMMHQLQSSSSFNYLVSHELRRNLHQVQEGLRAISQKIEYKDKAALQTSITKVGSLDTLVQSLLSLAQLESQPIYQGLCNLNDLWGDVQEEMNIPPNCQIQVGQLPTIKADVLLMKQVFHNLVENSIKYTRAQQAIEIHIKASASQLLRIEVSDNGIGFDETLETQLFKPFHRLHKQLEGTGLGLVVVKTIIGKHQGEVFARNNPKGGATFGFTLPLELIV